MESETSAALARRLIGCKIAPLPLTDLRQFDILHAYRSTFPLLLTRSR
jgi:hypothetical protein